MNFSAANQTRAGIRARCFVRLLGSLAAGGLLGGVIHAADLPAENIFSSSPTLPRELQRVAVLPLAANGPGADLSEGCAALQPVLLAALVRAEKFEVVSVRPEDLRASSGRAAWTGAEPLPKEFFDSLRREYGCDAVLFCELTVYHAYAPLAIGWRLKLADARTRKIIWAADEVFAAGQPDEFWKVWQFWLNENQVAAKDGVHWRLASSPRQFGGDTAAKLLSRLPAR